MEINEKKVDETILALLYLFSWQEKDSPEEIARVWKSYDWDVMNRLHEADLISDPVGKSKSVWVTEEGLKRGRELAEKLFSS